MSSDGDVVDILGGLRSPIRRRSELYSCRTCSLVFPSLQILTKHRESTPSMHMMCTYCTCPVDFVTANNLKHHYRVAHHNTYCAGCLLHFQTPGAKMRHDREKHIPCHPCGMYFFTPSLLQNHFAKSPRHAKTYCKKCAKNFAHPGHLKQHRAAEHPEVKPKYNRKSESKPIAPKGEQLPDHYATLKIPRNSTHKEILVAAKKRRIEVHPDNVKRHGGGKMTEEDMESMEDEAKRVGWAADILCDEGLREKYEGKLEPREEV